MDRARGEYVDFDEGLDWETPAEPESAPDEPGRLRRVRALVVACVLGGLIIIGLGVLGTRVLVDELRGPTAHEQLVSRIKDAAQDRLDDCVGRGVDRGVCASRAASACAGDPRWTLSDLTEIGSVCVFGRDD